jgi:hypothetical protein
MTVARIMCIASILNTWRPTPEKVSHYSPKLPGQCEGYLGKSYYITNNPNRVASSSSASALRPPGRHPRWNRVLYFWTPKATSSAANLGLIITAVTQRVGPDLVSGRELPVWPPTYARPDTRSGPAKSVGCVTSVIITSTLNMWRPNPKGVSHYSPRLPEQCEGYLGKAYYITNNPNGVAPSSSASALRPSGRRPRWNRVFYFWMPKATPPAANLGLQNKSPSKFEISAR